MIPHPPQSPPRVAPQPASTALATIQANPYWGGIVFDKAQAALGGRTPGTWHLLEAEQQLLTQLIGAAAQAQAVPA